MTEEHELIVITCCKMIDKHNIIKPLPLRMAYRKGDKSIHNSVPYKDKIINSLVYNYVTATLSTPMNEG